jgi:NADPH:quinone reductase-like Zn-dependent oxidoreductase
VKGFGFEEHGGIDRLTFVEIPEPLLGPGEIRIRVRAAAFNRLDRFVLAGIPGVPVARPHVLGSDGAGEVESVGPGVNGWKRGDRVLLNPGLWDGTCAACLAHEESLCRRFQILGEHVQGTATRYVCVPAHNVHRLSDRLTFAEGAAAPLVFQTVYRALISVGQLQPGETVAIIGAGGGTATAAAQVARWRGARVVVVSRSEAKAAQARSLLGVETLVVPAPESLDGALWAWSGKQGIDVIFDSVGRPTVGRSLKALSRGGRLVVIGATAGPMAELDLRTLFWRQASIRGSTMASAAEVAAVLGLLDAGTLRPVIDRAFPFAEARAAFGRLEAPDLFGKVVLEGPPD